MLLALLLVVGRRRLERCPSEESLRDWLHCVVVRQVVTVGWVNMIDSWQLAN